MSPQKALKVAIVHYWFVAERGGEKVVRALCDLYPQAVLFAHVADRALCARLFPGHEVRTSFISRLPFARRLYQSYLPLMPLALEMLDLQDFDLVLSSESGPAKGVIPSPGATHVCYCHSPMRYLWDQFHSYRRTAGLVARTAMPLLAHGLRHWDAVSANRVDAFVANSTFVAQRIRKYYRRDAVVAAPPVDIDFFRRDRREADPSLSDAFLWVGQLIPYKRPDLAVHAAAATGARLIMIGEGELSRTLATETGKNVEFWGRADGETLARAYRSCRALIFPGEEDFGIVPVEALASGLPVIALGRGGALDTVRDGESGILFDEQSVDALVAAIRRFQSVEAQFDRDRIALHARAFDSSAFRKKIIEIVDEAMNESAKRRDRARRPFVSDA